MAKIELSQKKILEALQSQTVRDALSEKADEISRRAESIASSEDVEAEFWIAEGIRPGGRPFARVMCDNIDQEHGTSKTRRSRVLGRAGEEVLPGEVS